LKRLLDSTKDEKLAFGLTTYRSAKEKELMLGLDLQGGMSVTMEVGLDGLLKSLANYTKEAQFNKALGTGSCYQSQYQCRPDLFVQAGTEERKSKCKTCSLFRIAQ
jgi:hypothetical protein